MSDENENLQATGDEGQQAPQSQDNAGEGQQQASKPGDSSNTYASIIEQQQEQINALLAQTKTLNDQIVNMVNAGAQFNQAQQPAQQAQPPQPTSLASDEDWTLEGLAKEIGKRE